MATLEDVLGQYNQSNFDIGSTAALIRQLGQQAGLSEAELAAAVPVFGDYHRSVYNSGYTEGSNYSVIAQQAISDALKTRGANPAPFLQATQSFVDQGAQQAQQRWQATQEPDGGLLGDLGPIAQLAALIPGPQQPFLLAANAANSLSQGNVLGAALNGYGAWSGGWGGLSGGAEAALPAGVGGIDSGSLSQILGNGAYGPGGAFAPGMVDVMGGTESAMANAGANPSIPSWMQPSAGGVADTGFGANSVPSFYDTGTPNLLDATATTNTNLNTVTAPPDGGNVNFLDSLIDPWGAGVADPSLGVGDLNIPNYTGNVLDTVAPSVASATGNSAWDTYLNGGAGVLSGGGGGFSLPSGAMNAVSSLAKALGVSDAAALKMIGAGGGALLGSMGGQKQAGTTTTVNDIPDWLKPYATNLLNKGQDTVTANSVNPSAFAGSDAAMQNIMGGGSIQAPTFNPYGGSTTPQTSNSYLGSTTAPTSNSYIGQTVTPGTNQYLGQNNPFFEGVLNKSLNDTQGRVNNQFRNSAFGGSANQELLARQLGDQSNSMRYGEYNTQMQLSEADIARKLQSQQADMARNSSLAQNQGQFNANLSQTDLARNANLTQNQGQFNSNLYANDLTRNANLSNTDAARNQNAYQFGQGQAATAAANMPQYTANKTNAAFAPLTAQKGLFTSGSQTTSPYFTNPTGGALYGGLLGSQLFGGK